MVIELSPATLVDFNFDCYHKYYSNYRPLDDNHSISNQMLDTGFRLVKESVNGR